MVAVNRESRADGPAVSNGLELTWPASAVSLRAARELVREWLDDVDRAGIEPQVSLVVTELLTNAREWSNAVTVHLSTRSLAEGVSISVTNTGSTFNAPRVMPAVDSERGRGLAIVRSLAESLVVETSGDSVTVTAVIV